VVSILVLLVPDVSTAWLAGPADWAEAFRVPAARRAAKHTHILDISCLPSRIEKPLKIEIMYGDLQTAMTSPCVLAPDRRFRIANFRPTVPA
jgi:hypothetical protein